MKIAYLSQSYPPMVSGAALAVQQLAEGMAARGHQILVLAASERGYAYQTRANGLRVARLQSFPNPFRVGQRFLPWLDRATAGELHAFRPDILHLHDFSPVGLAGLRAVRTLNVPAVLTLHLLPPTLSAYAPPLPGLRQMTDAGLWAYYDWVAQQCRAVATPTQASADIVRAHIRCDPVVAQMDERAQRECHRSGRVAGVRSRVTAPPALSRRVPWCRPTSDRPAP